MHFLLRKEQGLPLLALFLTPGAKTKINQTHFKRYNPKPSKKKKRPMQQHTTDDKGPWIQCDRCHTWIPAFSDNIHDITIYEDSNPHHLDYFCPDCRAKPDEPRKSSRVRKRSRALRD